MKFEIKNVTPFILSIPQNEILCINLTNYKISIRKTTQLVKNARAK